VKGIVRRSCCSDNSATGFWLTARRWCVGLLVDMSSLFNSVLCGSRWRRIESNLFLQVSLSQDGLIIITSFTLCSVSTILLVLPAILLMLTLNLFLLCGVSGIPLFPLHPRPLIRFSTGLRSGIHPAVILVPFSLASSVVSSSFLIPGLIASGVLVLKLVGKATSAFGYKYLARDLIFSHVPPVSLFTIPFAAGIP
jgi:hypothetical protein